MTRRITVTREDGTAYEVDIPERIVKRFEGLSKSMAKLIKELREHAPDGNLYFDESTWNLMAGPSHAKSFGEPALHGNVIASKNVPKSGGGGW